MRQIRLPGIQLLLSLMILKGNDILVNTHWFSYIYWSFAVCVWCCNGRHHQKQPQGLWSVLSGPIVWVCGYQTTTQVPSFLRLPKQPLILYSWKRCRQYLEGVKAPLVPSQTLFLSDCPTFSCSVFRVVCCPHNLLFWRHCLSCAASSVLFPVHLSFSSWAVFGASLLLTFPSVYISVALWQDTSAIGCKERNLKWE